MNRQAVWQQFKNLVVVCLLCWSSLVCSHPAQPSSLQLALEDDGLYAELHLAIDQLQMADASMPAQFDTLNAQQLAYLQDYLRQHLQLLLPQAGQPKPQPGRQLDWQWLGWSVNHQDQQQTGTAMLVVRVCWPASSWQADQALALVLQLDAIVHRVVNHRTLVTVKNTGFSQWLRRKHVQLPLLDVQQAVQREPGMLEYLGYGFEHIAAGADHLLFMLALLLPAPLFSAKRRSGNRAWPVYQRLLLLVSAFTVGHMISLLAAAMGWQPFSASLVEMAVALSVALSALLALLPTSGQRWMLLLTLVFGLIHGSAFAEILGNLHVTGWSLLLDLLAFNLGVELMQLLLVVMWVPLLLALYQLRPNGYQALRQIMAVTIALLALGWLIQRTGWLGQQDWLQQLSEWLPQAVALSWGLLLMSLLWLWIQLKWRPAPRQPLEY
ncbi:HupE/UreJ family protein [Oceanobacter mangrovi]|uniref:HupE/UreJ family protein n=1 Tax=Oceanobacter mangrovi TaxID=2862510 RepID=UPI001C8ED48D|nr:HupE/UreJ family protein [Oceanobacter mangrovi]